MGKNEEKIAIYSRKSRFTGKGESIGNQIELCKSYVAGMFGEKYAEECEIFEDEGFSGGNLKRPDFQKMMEQVRRRRFRAIVVYRLDRISRNISDFTGLIDELTKLDVSFISIREQFDTGTPMGRAMMFIISVFSQLERETIAERIRDNMQELAKTGRWLGGNTPTGYGSESVSAVSVDGKMRKVCKLRLITEEAEIVRMIFDLYTQFDSLTATEAELLRRGIKTKKGNNFSRFSIKAILQNPVYMIADEDAFEYMQEKSACIFADPGEFDGQHGLMVYNRTEQEKGKTAVYLPETEWIVAVGKHPGLIPAKQWIRVQRSLERNKSKTYRKPRTNEALLTGHLFCKCGGRMYPKRSGRITEGAPAFTYVCKIKERSKGTMCGGKNVNGNELDRAIVGQIRELREDSRWFMNCVRKNTVINAGTAKDTEARLSALRVKLSENLKKIDGLLDALETVGDSSARIHITGRIEQLSEENEKIKESIGIMESEIFAGKLENSMLDELRDSLQKFPRAVDAMSVEEKRTAVGLVIQEVVWDGENAHVRLTGAGAEELADLRKRWCEDSK